MCARDKWAAGVARSSDDTSVDRSRVKPLVLVEDVCENVLWFLAIVEAAELLTSVGI